MFRFPKGLLSGKENAVLKLGLEVKGLYLPVKEIKVGNPKRMKKKRCFWRLLKAMRIGKKKNTQSKNSHKAVNLK